MEKKAYLVIGNNVDLSKFVFEDGAFVAGVDRGALLLLENGIRTDLAYGDFDSVPVESLPAIEKHAKETVRLNPIKDVTDTEGVLQLLTERGYKRFVLLGAIQGKRIEHFLSILSLLKTYPEMEILDDSSKIYRIDPSCSPYTMKKDKYMYVSFFSFGKTELSLDGFKYGLKNYLLENTCSLTVSNAIPSKGTVTFSGSPLLVIESKKDH